MKLIKRDTDYAVRAACFILKRRKRVCAAELVEKLKIPRPFLRKILQTLDKKRILRSYKGRGGGFLLARPAQKIMLMDLIEIFQGPLRLNECLFKKFACPNIKKCPLRKKINKIERYALKELGSINLSSLSKRGG